MGISFWGLSGVIPRLKGCLRLSIDHLTGPDRKIVGGTLADLSSGVNLKDLKAISDLVAINSLVIN